MTMRIQKYLSEQGVCSRREAEDLIKRGLVALNGVVVREMGVQMNPSTDTVTVLPFGQREIAKKQSIILYKPRGIASSRIASEGKNVYDLFPQFENLDIIGRLDKASEGLLLLSEDGVIAKAVTGDAHAVEKEYEVTVREDVNAGRLKKLEPGITLEDGPTLPCQTKLIGPHRFRIIIREGRKHQIRRMCEFLHLTVVQLRRLRIGPITLGDLKPGAFRALTESQVTTLKAQGN
ncbi:MAG: rRNA pseudouridine synthase [Candidatus Pacebacteria bacterium]|nr:rRNA pseudouridine synthase [Candidatus Paceibacterota bacterium]